MLGDVSVYHHGYVVRAEVTAHSTAFIGHERRCQLIARHRWGITRRTATPEPTGSGVAAGKPSPIPIFPSNFTSVPASFPLGKVSWGLRNQMPGGRRLHNVYLEGMPTRYRWLRALATTDVDSGPGAPLGAAHRRCSRDQARQTLPGTNLYWVISIRRKQGGLPTRHDTSSLGRTQSCISTVCIQANNILVVMGNILLMRRPPPRSLSGIASIGYVPLPVLRPHRISSRLDPPRLGTLSSVPKRPQIPHQDPCQVGVLGPQRCLSLVQG